MPGIRQLVATALIAASAVAVNAAGVLSPMNGAMPLDRQALTPADFAIPASQGRIPRQGSGNIFDNGGFEQLDLSNQPLYWATVGIPEIRSEYVSSEFTNHYAHLSRINRYYAAPPAQFVFPVPAWQTVTVGARVRGEFGVEAPVMYWELGNPDTGETRFRSVVRESGDFRDWSPFYASFTRLPNETAAGFQISSRFDIGWVDFDDLFLVTEEIANGGFETDESGLPPEQRWRLGGDADIVTSDALVGAKSLRLGPGATAARFVAATQFGVEYFIAGRMNGLVYLTEEYLKSNGVRFGGTTFQTGPYLGDLFFVGPIGMSPGAEMAEVSFSNTGNSPVIIDDVSRGWISVWPKVFEPVANSASPTVRLAAAWPGKLDGAQIAILDSDSTQVDLLTTLQQDGSTVWTNYDGGTLPAGVYTARFELTGTGGESISPERTFEIRRPDAWPTRLEDFDQDEFQRVAWVWLFSENNSPPDSTVDDIRTKLQRAKDDGFNLLWISAREEQFALVRDAMEDVRLPYFIAPGGLYPLFDPPQGNATFDPQGIVDALEPLSIFKGEHFCHGLYLKDEPNVGGVFSVQRLTDVARLMQRDGEFPPVVTFLSSGAPISGADFPFFCTYHYPFGAQAILPEDALAAIINPVKQYVNMAIAQDRNYWLGVQGYSVVDTTPVMRGSECRVELGIGLTLGMKGYFVFTYNPISYLEGLRTFQYGETERLHAFQDFNARVGAINTLLMALPTSRTAPTQSNLLARVAIAGNGDAFAFVTNTHPDHNLSFVVDTDAATQMTDVESNVTTPLGTQHHGALGPGDWAIYRFANNAQPTNFTGTLTNATAFENTADVAVAGNFTTAAAPSFIGLKPDGTALATTEGTLHNVYSLAPGHIGDVLFREDHQAINGAARYLNNDTIVFGSQWLGPRVYTQQGNTFTPYFTKLKESGTGIDLLLDGNAMWVTQAYWGVDRLDVTPPSGSVRRDHVFADLNGFRGIYGPFSDDSVIAVEDLGGLYRMTFDGTAITSEPLTQQSQYARGDFVESNGKRRLVLGSLDRQFNVFDLTENGELSSVTNVNDPGIVDANKAAWFDSRNLAIVDPRFGVRIYYVGDNGDSMLTGVWLPAERPFFITSIDTLGDGTIAVGLLPSKIVVGNVRDLLRQQGWMFY